MKPKRERGNSDIKLPWYIHVRYHTRHPNRVENIYECADIAGIFPTPRGIMAKKEKEKIIETGDMPNNQITK